MITKQDLQAAIAECQEVRNPTSNTCIKLAAYYTVKEHLYPESKAAPQYSYAANEVEKVTYESDTEFSQAIRGKPVDEVLAVMDELMQTLEAVNPRLYASVLKKIV